MRTLINRVALAALFLAFGSTAGTAALVNGIQAVVDESIITRYEVEQLTMPAVRVLERQLGSQSDEFYKKIAEAERDNVEQLTRRRVIIHEFQTAGYSLPESVLDDMVEDEIRRQYKDRRTMAKSLQEKGITFEKFREKLREQFIVQAMRNKNISAEILVSPKKLEDYYNAKRESFKLADQVKLRMFTIPKSAEEEGLNPGKLAEEILFKLKDGADFDAMAAEYSQRAAKPQEGEWYERPKLRKELAEATSGVAAGNYCNVVETPEAFYLVQVVEVKPEHYKPLSEVRAQIEHDLVLEERERLERNWIEKLKKKTFIVYY